MSDLDPYVSYVLPDFVKTAIPPHHDEQRSGLGVHEWARGVLIELCRLFRATPVSLDYVEHVDPVTRNHQRSAIKAVITESATVTNNSADKNETSDGPVATPPDLTVEYSFGPVDNGRITWDLTVDGQLIKADDEPTPNKRGIARLVYRHVRRF
jgi:hypothetical protein